MLSEVIATARRRLLCNALAFHFAIALTVAFAVLSLLLLLGTDILDWRWLIVLPGAPLAAGIWIACWRLPGTYPTAQLVDRRLKLADALSTALFFAGPHPPRRCDEGVRLAQQADAARIAAGVDLRQAVPIRIPRALYVALLPAIVAAGLFHMRYSFDARLDLRPPLNGIMQQLIADVRTELAKLEAELQRQFAPEQRKDEEAKQRQSGADGEDPASTPPENTDSKNAGSGSASRQQTEMADNTFAEEPQGSQQQQSQSGEAQTESETNSPSSQGRDGRQRQQAAGNQQSGSSDSSSSMMSKLKDSMANLLSLAKSQPGGSGTPQPGKPGDSRPQNSRQQAGEQGSDSADAEPGEDPGQSGKGRPSGNGQSSKPRSDKLAGSGAGNEEGAKEILRAEQLEAMGKLSAIFGKRAQNLAGEFTAEATQGPQVLKTQYQRRGASHTDVHAKADRDEVPVAFQDYVQRYFELVKESGRAGRGPSRAVTAATRRSRAAR